MTWIQVLQIILMLSILVIPHEFGHYFTAKWFKCRVEKFYLFFNPGFSLFKKKIGETEWGIGWLPLGGYVKISGMIDESMDTDQMKSEPKPWEFRSKKPWQKIIILLGGIVVNVLLAWVIYAGMYSYYGHKYLSVEEINKQGLVFSEAAKEIGFKDGDKILSVDGKTQIQFKRQVLDILLGNTVEIERNGKKETLHITDAQKAFIFENDGRAFMLPSIKSVLVAYVDSTHQNYKTLQTGDIIIKLDGKNYTNFNDFKTILDTYKNQTIPVEIQRENNIVTTNVKVNSEGRLGIAVNYNPQDYLVTEQYNFFTALPIAIEEAFTILNYNIKNIKLIFKPKTKAYKQVRGPIGITRVLPTTWDWEFFWSFTAMFSMWLAFINLLPIPGLDGGHASFALAEWITGKTIDNKTMGIVQTIGVIILLTLMALIFGKDIYDWIVDTRIS